MQSTMENLETDETSYGDMLSDKKVIQSAMFEIKQ